MAAYEGNIDVANLLVESGANSEHFSSLEHIDFDTVRNTAIGIRQTWKRSM